MTAAGNGRPLTAAEAAALVGATLSGPPVHQLTGVASLTEAGPGDVAFLVSSRWVPYFRSSRAGAVLVPPALADTQPGPRTRLVVDDPRAAVRRLAAWFAPPPVWGIHQTARIGRRVRWSGRLYVGPGAVIGNAVTLGPDCRIGAQAVIADEVRLGARVAVQPGARVGMPGFSHLAGREGPETIPHAGLCELGDDVEIGANTTVDRGSIGATTVGDGTKIDNLVQIGHNVRIGRRCIIMAQVGIAGTTDIGDDVMLAGQAGLAGQLTVGSGARVAAQAGVIGDVPPGATVSGYPARDHRQVLRQAAALGRLAPVAARLERLARDDEHR